MDFSAKRFFMSGFIFWLAIAAISVWYLIPIRKHIKLGIDLVGGTYITLDVEVEEAVKHELREKQKSLVELLKDKDKKVPISQKIEEKSFLLNFENNIDASEAQLVIREDLLGYSATVLGNVLKVELSANKLAELKKWAVDSNIEVLNTRLRKFGTEDT